MKIKSLIIKLLKAETMAKQRQDWKEKSRLNWGTQIEEGQTLPNEYLQLGCLMRIADATELMAKNYLQIEADLKLWKEKSGRQDKAIERLENQLRTWKGVATRHKNELQELKRKLTTPL